MRVLTFNQFQLLLSEAIGFGLRLIIVQDDLCGGVTDRVELFIIQDVADNANDLVAAPIFHLICKCHTVSVEGGGVL